jgi:hypothetical protein
MRCLHPQEKEQLAPVEEAATGLAEAPEATPSVEEREFVAQSPPSACSPPCTPPRPASCLFSSTPQPGCSSPRFGRGTRMLTTRTWSSRPCQRLGRYTPWLPLCAQSSLSGGGLQLGAGRELHPRQAHRCAGRGEFGDGLRGEVVAVGDGRTVGDKKVEPSVKASA